MKKILLIILAFAICSFSYNHPELDWKTVTSKNFSIIYNESTEPALYACWKIAEEAYNKYVRVYKYPEGQKINLILADEDDYSNGLASWTDNTIKIWIPDSRFDLRDMSVWLRDVIYHEVAHIMSMEKNPNMQMLYWVMGGGYYSQDLNVEYMEPIAKFAFMPLWFSEGTAQLRSDELGGDCRDSRREMVLRDAAINKRLLTLDEMGHFTHDMIGNELVYNQGYSFTKYLEANFGKKGMSQIWNKYKNKKFTGRNFQKIFFDKFKKSLNEEYVKWSKSILGDMKTTEEKDNSSVYYSGGTINKIPKINKTGDKIGFLSSGKDDFGRTDLVIMDVKTKDILKKINYVRSDWEFSNDGNGIYFLKARKPNQHGSFLNDLYYCDLAGGRENKITSSARIYDFAIDEKGLNAYAISYRKSRFGFIKISLKNNEIEYIDSPEIGEGYMTLDLRGDKIVLTALLHGKSSIYLYDISSNKIESLLQNNAHEEDASFGADGRIYYSADYNNVPNIYSVDVTGKDMKKHTSVTTGVFNPYFDGDKLWFSKYDNRSFKICNLESKEISYTLQELPNCKYSDIPKPKGKVNISDSNYKAKTGRAVWSGFSFVSLTDMDDALQDMVLQRKTDSVWNIGLDIYLGLNMNKSDPLEKKIVYGGVAAAIGNVFSDSISSDIDSSASLRFNKRRITLSSKERIKKRDRMSSFVNEYSVNQESDDDSTEASAFSGYFIAAPYWGVESRKLKPTIGVDIEVQLIAMVPYGFYSYPFVDFQLGRDLHAGFSPMLSLYPLYLIDEELSEGAFAADMPLWLNWIHTNSINEDIQYNLGGVSFFEIFAGPQVSPQIETHNGDTMVQSSFIFKAGLSAQHYFSVFKYGSISLGGAFQYSISNREMNSTTGIWTSDDITAFVDTVESKSIMGGLVSSDVAFPIVRDINRGKLYMDNLYGGLHYSSTIVASGKYLENSDKDLITDKDFNSPNAYCDHKIGVSLSLGMIKDYMFDRRLQIMLYRKLYEEETGVDIKFSF